jgi:hypothetical protein
MGGKRPTLAETGGVRKPSGYALFCNFVARTGITETKSRERRVIGKTAIRSKGAMLRKWISDCNTAGPAIGFMGSLASGIPKT